MKHFALPAVFLFLALFLLFPLGVVLTDAFYIDLPRPDGTLAPQFSLQAFLLLWDNTFYRDCLINSFFIAVASTAATLLISIPLALLFHRCTFPFKPWLASLLLLPLILPPFVGAIGLKQILSRFGSVNLLLAQFGLVDLSNPPDWFGSGGFAGIILLETLHLYPILWLSLQAALANVDPSLRDAARNLGASPFTVFRTVTLPLALPGLFAGSSLVFIAAFTDLGVPLMFDFQATVPTQIFNLVTQPDNPMGYALVVVMLVVVSVLFLAGRTWGEGSYAMMARSASYEDSHHLRGLPAWAATGAVMLLLALSLLPHFGVILQAFAERWFFSVAPQSLTIDHFSEVFQLPLTTLSMRNSLFYATLAALLDLGLGVLIAYLLARESFRGKSLLDLLAMLPLALPGLVMAFAYFVAFSRPLFPGAEPNTWLASVNATWLAVFDPRENPVPLLIVAYAIHRLPFIVRAAYAGLQQTSVTLEEASANLGARPWQTLWRITLPLISANVIAGTVMTFSFAVLDVSNGMILAAEEQYYPITKAIYSLMGRITPTAPAVACALGVLAMLFLAAALALASRLLGRRLGQLFRA